VTDIYVIRARGIVVCRAGDGCVDLSCGYVYWAG